MKKLMTISLMILLVAALLSVGIFAAATEINFTAKGNQFTFTVLGATVGIRGYINNVENYNGNATPQSNPGNWAINKAFDERNYAIIIRIEFTNNGNNDTTISIAKTNPASSNIVVTGGVLGSGAQSGVVSSGNTITFQYVATLINFKSVVNETTFKLTATMSVQ